MICNQCIGAGLKSCVYLKRSNVFSSGKRSYYNEVGKYVVRNGSNGFAGGSSRMHDMATALRSP